ncbi:tRNA pseudouridine(55) synthase TruB [uncultured Bifidobacterium sp.]|uniref:tRNA pseudouridine(55) synthase TruB n=1 Tax=uncultured Bifidobacterium sp. TaxID=165187 RepID=UPI0028DB9423|nr:tRNA pseudouridine(55) synthase TruB [uncultured Bifidobacterium sp.]
MTSDFEAPVSGRGMSGVSGLLLVDKPRGVTSHDVVAAVRSVLRMRRVGHAGTLDPMATGLLLVGFGHATRLLRAAMGSDKTYEATVRLGVSTTTDDADGDVLRLVHAATPEACNDDPTTRVLARRDIEAVVRDHLLGHISQVPSRFSAIRVGGRHAYERARAGEDFALEAREVDIRSFEVAEPRSATVAVAGSPTPVVDVDVRVSCSSGTYVRSLARDLGDLLGVGGHLVALRRVRVGGFRVSEPRVVHASAASRTIRRRDGVTCDVSVARMETDADGLIRRALPLASAAARMMPVLPVDAAQARDLRFGRAIRPSYAVDGPVAAICGAGADIDAGGSPSEGATGDGRPVGDDLVALVEPTDDAVKPTVVFPAAEMGRGGRVPASRTADEGEGR